MSLDLFARWAEAVANKDLEDQPSVFGWFKRCLKDRDIAPEDLDRQNYESIFADMALEGMAPTAFPSNDRIIRRFYRWAADRRIIANVPFGDFPLGEAPKMRRPSTTEDEILRLIQGAVRLAADARRPSKSRLTAARCSLAVALAFYSGLKSQQMDQLKIAVLVDLLKREALPASMYAAATAYAELVGPMLKQPEGALFPRRASKQAQDEKFPGGDTKFYLKAIVGVAAELDFHTPERFTLQEVGRLRTSNLHRLDHVEIAGAPIREDLSNYVSPPNDWSAEEIASLAKMHPRYV